MFIIKYKKIFYIFSTLSIAAAVFFVVFFGFNFGIDFTGGSMMEVEYTNARPDISKIKDSISKLEYGKIIIQPTGDKGYIIRTRTLKNTEHAPLLDVLKSMACN